MHACQKLASLPVWVKILFVFFIGQVLWATNAGLVYRTDERASRAKAAPPGGSPETRTDPGNETHDLI